MMQEHSIEKIAIKCTFCGCIEEIEATIFKKALAYYSEKEIRAQYECPYCKTHKKKIRRM